MRYSKHLYPAGINLLHILTLGLHLSSYLILLLDGSYFPMWLLALLVHLFNATHTTRLVREISNEEEISQSIILAGNI